MKIGRIGILVFTLWCLHTASIDAQVRWRGGDGNWTDANWAGGSGPGGQPGAGQNVSINRSAGTIIVSSDLGAVGRFGDLSQRGGVIRIEPNGALEFGGTVRIAEGATGTGTVHLVGDLIIDGGLDLGYGNGDGAGRAVGELAVEGDARLLVGGNMDTWWDPGAQLSLTGDNVEVVVGGTFFFGPAFTMTANINSDRFSTVQVLENLNIAGGNGTLAVNFVDGYEPQIGSSWTLFDAPQRGGTIPTWEFPDLGVGKRLTVNYASGGQHGQVVTLDLTNTLNLRIDKQTGTAVIENPIPGGDTLDIDGYIIRSPSGSLDVAGFAGLNQPGWQPGLPPSQSAQLLSETNFHGSTPIATGMSMPLGNLLSLTGSEDLQFVYHVAGGDTRQGTVQYVGGIAGDFDGDGAITAADIDLMGAAIRGASTDSQFDLDGSGQAELPDLKQLVRGLLGSWIGDANLDGEFNSGDLVQVFQTGQYEDGVAANSNWSTGDWNADLEFDTGDLVFAFQDGGFEQGPAAAVAAVPEPSATILLLWGLALAWSGRRAGLVPRQKQ